MLFRVYGNGYSCGWLLINPKVNCYILHYYYINEDNRKERVYKQVVLHMKLNEPMTSQTEWSSWSISISEYKNDKRQVEKNGSPSLY